MNNSSFASFRLNEPIILPKALEGFSFGTAPARSVSVSEEIASIFPHLESQYVQSILRKGGERFPPLKIGVVLSGGQAPGGHNVLAGIWDAIKQSGGALFGFKGGFKGILTDSFRVLEDAEINSVRNTGGFDLLGSGRTKIDSDEEIKRAVATLQKHELDGLVVVGGDDSNTNAAYLAESLQGRGPVIIGVPKTIDGDLRSCEIPISFGFDTACKVYSEIIGNIAKDVISSKKYYHFIRLMGRKASHITLECALQTHPNLALISEEIAANNSTLQDVVKEMADFVEERYSQNLRHGVILVPEGVIDHMSDMRKLIAELNELFAPNHPLASFIQEKTLPSERLDLVLANISKDARGCLALFPRPLAETLVYERDPYGNPPLSRIETERVFAHFIDKELRARAMKSGKTVPFAFQTTFLGYEGRSAYPSYFDAHYCYALGKLSVIMVVKKLTGYMAAIPNVYEPVDQWRPVAVPLVSMLSMERRLGKNKAVIAKQPVDLFGPLFAQFAEQRDRWRLDDHYQHPGPIQYWGPKPLVESPCISISK